MRTKPLGQQGQGPTLALAAAGLAAVLLLFTLVWPMGAGGLFGKASPDQATLASAVRAIEGLRALVDPQTRLGRLNTQTLNQIQADISKIQEQGTERAARAMLLAQAAKELSFFNQQMLSTEQALALVPGLQKTAPLTETFWPGLESMRPVVARALPRAAGSAPETLSRFHEGLVGALTAREEILLRSNFDWQTQGSTRGLTAGGTPVNKIVLGLALALFAASTAMFWINARRPSPVNPKTNFKDEPLLAFNQGQREQLEFRLSKLLRSIEDLKSQHDLQADLQAKQEAQKTTEATQLANSLAALAAALEIVKDISQGYNAGTHQENLVYDFARVSELLEISLQHLKDNVAAPPISTTPFNFSQLVADLESITASLSSLKAPARS